VFPIPPSFFIFVFQPVVKRLGVIEYVIVIQEKKMTSGQADSGQLEA
jgi:hypothetical protein